MKWVYGLFQDSFFLYLIYNSSNKVKNRYCMPLLMQCRFKVHETNINKIKQVVQCRGYISIFFNTS